MKIQNYAFSCCKSALFVLAFYKFKLTFQAEKNGSAKILLQKCYNYEIYILGKINNSKFVWILSFYISIGTLKGYTGKLCACNNTGWSDTRLQNFILIFATRSVLLQYYSEVSKWTDKIWNGISRQHPRSRRGQPGTTSQNDRKRKGGHPLWSHSQLQQPSQWVWTRRVQRSHV